MGGKEGKAKLHWHKRPSTWSVSCQYIRCPKFFSKMPQNRHSITTTFPPSIKIVKSVKLNNPALFVIEPYLYIRIKITRPTGWELRQSGSKQWHNRDKIDSFRGIFSFLLIHIRFVEVSKVVPYFAGRCQFSNWKSGPHSNGHYWTKQCRQNH